MMVSIAHRRVFEKDFPVILHTSIKSLHAGWICMLFHNALSRDMIFPTM